MTLLKVHDAAERLGVSYPTLKQWIYKKKIKVSKTAGGHYRVPAAEIARLLQVKEFKRQSKDEVLATLSSRNKLLGKVVVVKVDGLLAQVTLEIGGQFVSAIITAESCKELALKPGASAFALFKATDVMMSRK